MDGTEFPAEVLLSAISHTEGQKIQANVRDITERKRAERALHDSQEQMRQILALTGKGDLIIDPFIGVGTTAVAATLHGRRAAGADLKGEYLQIARQRIKAAVAGTLKRRPFGKPVYEPKPNTPLTTPPDRAARRIT